MPGCISDSPQACNTKKCKLCKWPVSEMLNRPRWVGGSGWEFSMKTVLTMQDKWQWHSCTSRNNSVNPLSGPWQRVFNEVIHIPQLYPVAASGSMATDSFEYRAGWSDSIGSSYMRESWQCVLLKQTAKTAEVVFKLCMSSLPCVDGNLKYLGQLLCMNWTDNPLQTVHSNS